MSERIDPSNQLELPGGSSLTFSTPEGLALAQGLIATGEDYPVELDDLCEFVWGESSSVVNPDVFKANLDEVTERLKASGKNLKVLELEGKSFFYLEDSSDELQKVVVSDEAELGQADLVVAEKKHVIQADSDTVINHIQGALTEMDSDKLRQIAELEPARYAAEVQSLLVKIEDYQAGNLPSPSHFEVVEAGTYDEKITLVRNQLVALCARFVIDPASMRTVQRWGRELNQMVIFSGGGEIGRQVVYEAMSGLSDVERSVILSQMSMTKRYEIMMVGLDQIDEREMASFVNSAVYQFSRDENCDDIALILEAIDNRDNLHGFSSKAVIDAIYQYFKSPRYIFNKILEAGKLGDFTELVQGFFATHEETAKLNPLLLDLEESDIVPFRKRI